MYSRWFRRIAMLFILLLLYTTTIKYGEVRDALYASELLKPINQRLALTSTEFKYSSYVDYQVDRFMQRASLAGVSIAVVQDEKLVFSKSYGYANIEDSIKTTPEHLFRVASVSKLITATAIMKLVDDGKLSLNDKVFGESGIFNDSIYLEIKDKKLKDISIQNLLDHTAGWTQRFGDPMFLPRTVAEKIGDKTPATVDSYIKFVIARNLHFPPGTMYSYSNIAYLFLGEIIERVSGMDYEDYVRFQLLFPIGIYDMHIGRNYSKDKFINEVNYYEQDGSHKVLACNGDTVMVSKSDGGNDIHLMGPAGGWVVSAPELARFMTAIDGFNAFPDILSNESLKQMTGGAGKPLGWKEVTSSGYWYRTGSFAGTAAMIHRRPDGVQWVFLTNSSSWKGPDFSEDIERLMRRIVRKVDGDWPEQDLFNYFDAESISYHQKSLNDKS